MKFVIDGYNFIHAVKTLEDRLPGGLQNAREALVYLCRQLLSKHKDIQSFCIVFDGSSQFFCSEEMPYPLIRIVYTATGEDADDRIIAILRSANGKNRVTVVSNDNYVTHHSRSLGAKILSASEFENKYMATKKPTYGVTHAWAPHGKVAEGIAKKITEEYKKILGIK